MVTYLKVQTSDQKSYKLNSKGYSILQYLIERTQYNTDRFTTDDPDLSSINGQLDSGHASQILDGLVRANLVKYNDGRYSVTLEGINAFREAEKIGGIKKTKGEKIIARRALLKDKLIELVRRNPKKAAEWIAAEVKYATRLEDHIPAPLPPVDNDESRAKRVRLGSDERIKSILRSLRRGSV
jgi:DNA-binding MarR family transcriptional regulator